MTVNDDRQQFQVKDGDRELQFSGVCLGRATSWRPGKTRWSEIAIYKTDVGMYLVVGIGRSTELNESDRHWASRFSDPDQVVQRLYLSGEGGIRRLPHTNREALLQACQVDRALSEAYPVNVVW